MKLIVFRMLEWGPDFHLADASRDFLDEGTWQADRWYALLWTDAETATHQSAPPSVTRSEQLNPDAIVGPCVSEDIAFRQGAGILMRAVAGRMG